MSSALPSDPREVLSRCVEIVERLIAEGREDDALRYLRESVLPALEEVARPQSSSDASA